MNKKALIAMSGGVDSSVAAYIMKTSGYEISGAIMKLCDDFGEDSSQSVNDAKAVCERLGVPFYVFDYRDDFKNLVVDDFIRVYEEGGTPNPCVVCNKKMKVGKFIDGAKEITIFIRIVIPLAIPAVATIALFQTLAYWNEWYHPMLLINKSDFGASGK